jgi:hypothetical protein
MSQVDIPYVLCMVICPFNGMAINFGPKQCKSTSLRSKGLGQASYRPYRELAVL